MPFISPPPTNWSLNSTRGRWLTSPASPALPRAAATIGRSSFSARNWLNFSGIALRAGGTLTCTTRSCAAIRITWPVLRLLFRPRISQGSGAACGWVLG